MRPLNEITTEIKRLDRESAESVWTIGKLLNEAKLNTPHGQYSEWVLRELQFSASYAARLVRLYNEYSSGLPEGFAISTLLCTLPLEESLRNQVNEIILIAESTKQEAEALRSQAQKDSAEITAKLARLKDAQPDPVNLDAVREEIRAELRAEFEASKPKKQDPNSGELYELRKKHAEEMNAKNKEIIYLANEENFLKQEVNALARDLETARASAMSATAKAKTVEIRVEVPPADYDELKALAEEVPALRAAVQSLNEQRSHNGHESLLTELESRRKYCSFIHDVMIQLDIKGVPLFSDWRAEQEAGVK